jgi:hypothetical protein
MDPAEIRDTILSVFHANRSAPDAPFEEAAVLRFLFDPPVEYASARNSFKALRRINRFLHGIEERFGIAFTNDEWEKNWSLAGLSEAIGKKLDNPKAQVKFIEKRCMQSRREIFGLPFMAALVILFPLVCLIYKLGAPLWMPLGLAAIPLALLIKFGTGHHLHYRRVLQKFRQQNPLPG